MDTAVLRNFLIIAEMGNFSRAAERLFISQPALSRQIQQLEEELTTPLFNRSGQGVRLTQAGAYLAEKARALIHELESTKQGICTGRVAPAELIKLAIAPSLGHDLIPCLLEESSQWERPVFMNLISGTSSNFEEWLFRGSIDIAIMYDFLPKRPFHVFPIAVEELHIFFKPGTFPTSSTGLTADNLASSIMLLPDSSNIFRRQMESWMGAQGHQIRTRCDVGDHSVIRGCVTAGLGIAIMAKGAFQCERKLGLLESRPLMPSASRTVSIVVNAHHPRVEMLLALANDFQSTISRAVQSGQWQASLKI